MKRGNFASLALLSGALVLPGYADKVQFDQLPAAIQEQIRAQIGSAQIEDIDRDVRNGKTIYEVAFKKDGKSTELQFEDNSNPAAAASASTKALDSRKIKYAELPAEVKLSADKYVSDAEVNDVDRRVKNGRVTYEIGFKRNGGPQQELVLSQNGAVLSQTGSPATAPAIAPAPVPVNPAPARSGLTSRQMKYEDVPQNVRKVAESKLNHGDVSRVDRFVQNGSINYQIGFQREDGQYQELVVAEDGRILRNQLLANSGLGSAGTLQSGSSPVTNPGQASQYSFVTTPVQLQNSEEIGRANVPATVWRAVDKQAASGPVRQVRRGEWRGKTVYDVGFEDANKRSVKLQLDENGQIIYDSRLHSNSPTTLLK